MLIVTLGAGALLLAGCTSSVEESSETGPAGSPGDAVISAPGPTGTPAIDPASEAGLRQTLADQYAFIQKGDWSGVYDFSSPRCQLATPREDFVALVGEGYKGRDFSGPEEYLITVNGTVATVVVKSFDGKGKMKPATWAFMNGSWVHENC
ncbi:hypothetical protein ABIC28_002047 [Rhodococcus sp. PvR044]|uniref:hypothetical protein n=1 Tax=Rhodococcus sp. PvR044 TaxID=3156402 RepID=UPI003398CA65